jgi:hypothetical protein
MANDTKRGGLPVAVSSASVPAQHSPTAPAWPVRPAPSAVPLYDQGFGARRRARAFARNLDLGTAAAEAARRYFTAAEGAETAQQSAELAHERRRAVPVVAEIERAGLRTTLTQAGIQLDAVQHERDQRRADHLHRQQTDDLQWRKVALALLAEIADAENQVDAIRGTGNDEQARRTRQREIEEESHRIELLKRDLIALDLMVEIRERITAARRLGNGTLADATPEAFRRHHAMAQEILRSRSAAQAKIDDIYLRAAAERRPLSDDEIEQVDALANADAGAEAEVRRGGASDLK